ncbi:MAG TPA: ABC transporter permease subunit [Burkholderiaceae bacterium]|nr:ABC transporter permease subunit [Burkholderiaceae bacterium]
MLIWSRRGRYAAWSGALLLTAALFMAPLAVILVASLAGQWNGMLPSAPTLEHYRRSLSGDALLAIRASLVTGLLTSGLALASGTWAALALRDAGERATRAFGWIFFLPSAVPSVSVGLGLLVAFSRPPLVLNGTIVIVMMAHFVLVSSFAYGNVAAGLSRLPADFEQVAAVLGATPAYRLRHVTLPLIAPYLLAAFGLSFALSMGELGATVMVYPPRWVTLPVTIFGLGDRGETFTGAALTIMLVVATLALLLVLERLAKGSVGSAP